MPKFITVICKGCGMPFQARMKYVNRGNGCCCSISCRGKVGGKASTGRPISHGDASGGSMRKLYTVWKSMLYRCSPKNITNPKYKRYAGRGISVCEEWLKDYQAFKAWAISSGYTDELQIDRADNDGNYEPSNCRFVTCKENINNRSVSKTNQSHAKQIAEGTI